MTLQLFLMLLLGFIFGFLVASLIKWYRTKTARELAEEIYHVNENQRQQTIDTILEHLKASFGHLSLEALSRSTEEFIKLAQTKLSSEREVHQKELQEKKGLIDQQLQRMSAELENIAALMQTLEKDRAEKFGELANQLKASSEQTMQLIQTTSSLREALVSTKARGQWGERMAEDVLRMAGFIENINYLKQKQIEGSRSRPDYTFLLPRNLLLHMDVKFPLDNYLRYTEATSATDKAKYRADFLRDVKNHIKQISTREYIDPDKNTVDYVLLFIPNEQIYAFVQEQDSTIIDEGLRQHVIICSPMTLFAVLAVVRQAIDNFALEKTSQEILQLLGAFKKQWEEFIKKMEGLGKYLTSAMNEYESLVTTRKRQLEIPLQKIESLRGHRQLNAWQQKEKNNMLPSVTDEGGLI